MNKKEQQLVEALRTKLALKFTEPVNEDVLMPVDTSIIINGYTYNSYSMRVEKSCSSSFYHSIGKWHKTDSQGPIAQYSSKLLALKAMRNEVEQIYANKLRQIDLMIEEESTAEGIK